MRTVDSDQMDVRDKAYQQVYMAYMYICETNFLFLQEKLMKDFVLSFQTF